MKSSIPTSFLCLIATLLCLLLQQSASAFVLMSVSRTATTKSTAHILHATTTARNGLSYEDVEVGTGRRVNKGDAILVYYEGSFQEKTNNNPLQQPSKKIIFDSTDPGEPLEFIVGKGQLIPGMDIGICGDTSLEIEPMKIGGDRKLKIPSALAYGANQVGPIPANQDLEFQVSIVNAQASGGIDQSVKVKGIAAFVGTMGFFAVLGLFIATNYQNWF